jgi:hypothetical protein
LRKFTKSDTARAICNLFPDEDPSRIVRILERYGTETYEYEVDRVRLGILKLSEGNKDKLLQMVELAKTDYRDILFSAEYTQPGDRLIEDPYGAILQESTTDTSSSE